MNCHPAYLFSFNVLLYCSQYVSTLCTSLSPLDDQRYDEIFFFPPRYVRLHNQVHIYIYVYMREGKKIFFEADEKEWQSKIKLKMHRTFSHSYTQDFR